MSDIPGRAINELTRIHWKYYLLIFLIALSFRAILMVSLPWDNHIIDSYDNIAINIIEGTGFSYNGTDPTVCRAPAYPVYLLVILSIFGYQPLPFSILQIIDIFLDSVIAMVILWLTCLWFPKLHRYAKLTAGLVYAFNPISAYHALKIGPETLSILFFAIYLGLLHKTFRETPTNFSRTALLGIVGGIVLLNKSIFLPLILLIPVTLPILIPNLRKRSFYLNACLAVAISFVLTVPWIWRNIQVSEQVVLVQTLSGYNFWYDFTLDENRNSLIREGKLGNSIIEEGAVRLRDGKTYKPYHIGAYEDAQFERELRREAIDWAVNNPLQFTLKILDNLLSFWYMVETPKKMIFTALYSTLFILVAVRGAFITSQAGHKAETILFLTIIVLFDLIYSPVMSLLRYSLITYPVMSVLAGSCVWSFIPHIPVINRVPRMQRSFALPSANTHQSVK